MKKDLKYILKRYLSFLFGLFLVSFSYNIFLVQNNLVAGGVGGLAIVINKIYGLDVATFVISVNIFLVFLSFIALGKEATIKTILGSILYPIFIKLTSSLVGIIDLSTLDILFKAIVGGLLSGIGLGIIFREGFTTGGSDIVNMIISKYAKINIGNAMLITDTFIVTCGGIIFGIEIMAYAIITAVLVATLSNKTMLAINDHKTFYIRTSKVKEVKEYLIEELKYDVTVFDVMGGYNKEKGKMIMTVIKDNDYFKIRNGILEIDEAAFITITNSYETANPNKSIRELSK